MILFVLRLSINFGRLDDGWMMIGSWASVRRQWQERFLDFSSLCFSLPPYCNTSLRPRQSRATLLLNYWGFYPKQGFYLPKSIQASQRERVIKKKLGSRADTYIIHVNNSYQNIILCIRKRSCGWDNIGQFRIGWWRWWWCWYQQFEVRIFFIVWQPIIIIILLLHVRVFATTTKNGGESKKQKKNALMICIYQPGCCSIMYILGILSFVESLFAGWLSRRFVYMCWNYLKLAFKIMSIFSCFVKLDTTNNNTKNITLLLLLLQYLLYNNNNRYHLPTDQTKHKTHTHIKKKTQNKAGRTLPKIGTTRTRWRKFNISIKWRICWNGTSEKVVFGWYCSFDPSD